jgi:hypothetical protein
MEEPRPEAPGLIWRNGRTPVWRASPAAKRAGYPVKWVNLACFADDPRLLLARCQRLQAEMLAFMSGRGGRGAPAFDGTIGTLIEIYLTDRDSPYRRLKPSSVHPYDVYAGRLKATIGSRRIDRCDGRDVRRWFEAWSAPVEPSGHPTIAAARFAMMVLKAALSFGIQCRLEGCAGFKAILDEMRFASLAPRRQAPTAAEVKRAMEAARGRGQPTAALAYALQFEATLRPWDVIGEWLPLSDPRPSALIAGNRKWIGPTWGHIDSDMILTATPTKTEGRTRARVVIDLKLCPMVISEIATIPLESRSGPLVRDAATGQPFKHAVWQRLWRRVTEATGLPSELWNRDLRAGGITEAEDSDTRVEDRAKVAGHSNPKTTADVYDRGVLEAHRRVARARLAHRPKTNREAGV